MRGEDKTVIRNLALFADMSEANFETLLLGSFFQRFPKNVQLIEEGAPADFLHVVVDGQVELFASNTVGANAPWRSSNLCRLLFWPLS